MQNSSLFRQINDALEKRFGLRIQPSAETRLARCRNYILSKYQVDCLFDVGANKGQYAQRIRRGGFTESIISFEPTRVFKDLINQMSGDEKWSGFQVALSDFTGRNSMFISSNEALSSSLLRPAGILAEFDIDFSHQIEVEVRELDSFSDYLGEQNYLKLDVQGNEHFVLKGATSVLDSFCAVEFESALTPLYERESRFWELGSFLVNRGFRPEIVTPTHWSREGTLISLDAIFVKDES